MTDALTTSCPRTDCIVISCENTESTIYRVPKRDRFGKQVGPHMGDKTRHPNCIRCGRSWTVTSQDGQPDIITEHQSRA